MSVGTVPRPTRRRTALKLLGLLFLGGALCAAGGFVARQWPLLASFQPGTTSSRKAAGEEGSQAARQAVSALGRLEPEGEVIDVGVGALSTDRLLRLLVCEGQCVKEGDV